MATFLDVAEKLNTYKRSNGQRVLYVTDAAIVLDSPVVSGNEVAAVIEGQVCTFTLGVNCFRMLRTRRVETTETWTLDE
jgi:hypothetical protein